MKLIGCILLMGVILIFPSQSACAARNALRIWGLDVVPSLFPYMVLSKTLAERIKKTKLRAGPMVMLLGLTGGSPSGSAALSTFAPQRITSAKSVYALSALTCTLSPMFILHTVGNWLSDNQIGSVLLSIHICSAAFTASLLYFFLPDRALKSNLPPIPQHQDGPMVSAADAILGVGGCIIFFSVVSEAIRLLIPRQLTFVHPYIHAALEIAGGLKKLSEISFSPDCRAVIASGFMGFGGLSILSQNLLFLQPLGIKPSYLFLTGMIRGLISAALTSIVLAIL